MARPIRWSTEDMVVPMGAIGSYVGLKARFSDLVLLPCPYGDGRGPQDELVTEAALFDGNAAVWCCPMRHRHCLRDSQHTCWPGTRATKRFTPPARPCRC